MKFFAFLVALISLAFSSDTNVVAGPKKGEKAPLFQAKTLDWNDFTLSERIAEANSKKGLIVIDFWATWCAPCKKEFPAFQKIYKELNDKNVQFFAISIDDKRSDVWKYAKTDNKWEFPIVHDPNAFQGGKKYGADKSLPQIFIIDGNGLIVYKHSGEIKNMEEALKGQIEALLPGSFPQSKGKLAITGEISTK